MSRRSRNVTGAHGDDTDCDDNDDKDGNKTLKDDKCARMTVTFLTTKTAMQIAFWMTAHMDGCHHSVLFVLPRQNGEHVLRAPSARRSWILDLIRAASCGDRPPSPWSGDHRAPKRDQKDPSSDREATVNLKWHHCKHIEPVCRT